MKDYRVFGQEGVKDDRKASVIPLPALDVVTILKDPLFCFSLASPFPFPFVVSVGLFPSASARLRGSETERKPSPLGDWVGAAADGWALSLRPGSLKERTNSSLVFRSSECDWPRL